MKKLTNEQKNILLQQAHKLSPVVMLGNKGLTQAVHLEIERALEAHELIKIKVAGAEKEERQTIFDEISKKHQAELVKAIGFIGIFYRTNPSR
jgi:RNA-binding protein